EYQYHGANRLGANALVACIYGGMVAGPSAVNYIKGLKKSTAAVESRFFDEELKRQQEINNRLMKTDGSENPHVLHKVLGEWMTENVTVIRYNEKLAKMDDKLLEFLDRYKNIGLPDKGGWANNELVFARELYNMLILARVITQGAFRRNESRGAHYKPEFPNRDDANWLKTTKARYTPEGPQFTYEDVDTQYVKLRPRKYD
ncbi:MAG: succinate dehydrogenase flavoprotein subunit, partial [Deltaproteobacteria bacterium]|nr:succinate dehydrogenase flavoprotein subunit [Deltaproteobacteria bacterium]